VRPTNNGVIKSNTSAGFLGLYDSIWRISGNLSKGGAFKKIPFNFAADVYNAYRLNFRDNENG